MESLPRSDTINHQSTIYTTKMATRDQQTKRTRPNIVLVLTSRPGYGNDKSRNEAKHSTRSNIEALGTETTNRENEAKHTTRFNVEALVAETTNRENQLIANETRPSVQTRDKNQDFTDDVDYFSSSFSRYCYYYYYYYHHRH
jgi:hypothetical protein